MTASIVLLPVKRRRGRKVSRGPIAKVLLFPSPYGNDSARLRARERAAAVIARGDFPPLPTSWACPDSPRWRNWLSDLAGEYGAGWNETCFAFFDVLFRAGHGIDAAIDATQKLAADLARWECLRED